MNPRLEQLIDLWKRDLENSLAGPDRSALNALLQDEALVEEFTEWNAQAFSLEPAAALDEQAWKKVDAKVRTGFHDIFRPFYLSPWFLGLVLGGLSLGVTSGWFFFSQDKAPQEAPPPSEKLSRGSYQVINRAPKPGVRPSKENLSAPPIAWTSQPEKQGGKVVVKIDLEKAGDVAVTVRSAGQNPVRALYNGKMQAGQWKLEWDGRTDSGTVAQPGTYYIEIQSAAGTQTKKIELSKK
jgi:hypothetical protein